MAHQHAYARRIADVLAEDVVPPGDFMATGRLPDVPALCPALVVEGVGRIALPVIDAQVSELKLKAAEQAPYGKGSETVVDTDVRDAWQVDAAKVQLDEPWNDVIRDCVDTVAEQLGLHKDHDVVDAHLYKLIFYEVGGHFKPHQDSEKEARMFGTLVVQLPSTFTGGAVTVSHAGVTRTVQSDAACDSTFSYTAFYSDCTHELAPVESGHRMCLVYNLVVEDALVGMPLPRPDTCEKGTLHALRSAYADWRANGSLTRVAFCLEHEYTPGSLSFGNLKGRDRVMANTVRAAGVFDVHLALMKKVEVGEPETSHYKRSRRSYYDDDNSDDDDNANREMGEVDETSVSTDVVILPDGTKGRATIEPLDEEDDFVEQEEELFGDEPDEKEYEGNMGNYGPTLTFTYHRAALVLYPRFRTLQIARTLKWRLAVVISRLGDESNNNVSAEELAVIHSAWLHAFEKGSVDIACTLAALVCTSTLHDLTREHLVNTIIAMVEARRPHADHVLSKVLAVAEVRACGGDVHIRRLATKRLAQLPSPSAAAAPEDWRQPSARF